MGVLFNWFKDIKIQTEGHGMYKLTDIAYIDGDSTSHSYGNRSKLQNLFREKCNIEIPTIHEELMNNENCKPDLIEPSDRWSIATKFYLQKNVILFV